MNGNHTVYSGDMCKLGLTASSKQLWLSCSLPMCDCWQLPLEAYIDSHRLVEWAVCIQLGMWPASTSAVCQYQYTCALAGFTRSLERYSPCWHLWFPREGSNGEYHSRHWDICTCFQHSHKNSSIQLHEGWPTLHSPNCNLSSPHSHDDRELSTGIMQLLAISCQNLSCLLVRQPDHSHPSLPPHPERVVESSSLQARLAKHMRGCTISHSESL